ncbi:MAG: hypothetical protein R3188_03975 [Acidiferrobacterales bacterium]|jgi:hypothetical protein|nr:hypothetical protein [Acidiferrobacterales bacterium]
MHDLPFEIPNRVQWVAQDSDGSWWGYTVEPLRNESGWYENEVGEYMRLGQSAPIDWENSLRKVE